MSEHRRRDRVPVELVGLGTVNHTGQRFAFQAVDFSGMGFLIQVQGAYPTEGQKLALEFDALGLSHVPRHFLVGAVVKRTERIDEKVTCAVEFEDSTEALKALDQFYLERMMDLSI